MTSLCLAVIRVVRLGVTCDGRVPIGNALSYGAYKGAYKGAYTRGSVRMVQKKTPHVSRREGVYNWLRDLEIET